MVHKSKRPIHLQRAKLTLVQVIEIYTSNDKGEYLASKYNVDLNTIHRIWTRRTWAEYTIFLPTRQRRLKEPEHVTQ